MSFSGAKNMLDVIFIFFLTERMIKIKIEIETATFFPLPRLD